MTEYLEVPDSPTALFDDLYERGWTDGLPIVPPTPELVEQMVAAAGVPPDDTVAEVPPTLRRATVEAIAANGVMAGCKPEYMPTLIACVRAMCDPSFNLTGIQTTGDSVGPVAILNGPVRKQLDVNCEEGAAGPGRRSNATIGRAIRLILGNVGGAQPGSTDHGMLGQPGKFSFCLGENEERSPWEPFHVARGFEAEQSTVTIVAGLGAQFSWPLLVDAETTLASMVSAMTMIGHSTHGYWAHPLTWIVPPANAGLLAKAGYSRADVQQHLFEHARIPLSEFPQGENQMWSFEPVTDGDEAVLVRAPDELAIVVAGGYDYTGAMYLGGWHSRHVTLPIEN